MILRRCLALAVATGLISSSSSERLCASAWLNLDAALADMGKFWLQLDEFGRASLAYAGNPRDRSG